MPKPNVVKSETFHYRWTRDHKPALPAKPGEKMTFQANEVASWQITKRSEGSLAHRPVRCIQSLNMT